MKRMNDLRRNVEKGGRESGRKTIEAEGRLRKKMAKKEGSSKRKEEE